MHEALFKGIDLTEPLAFVCFREPLLGVLRHHFDSACLGALDFAQQCLDEWGGFYPYAVVVKTTGEQEMITTKMPAEQPESTSVIEAITRTLAAQRERLPGSCRRCGRASP